jgi:hypothetical protein
MTWIEPAVQCRAPACSSRRMPPARNARPGVGRGPRAAAAGSHTPREKNLLQVNFRSLRRERNLL